MMLRSTACVTKHCKEELTNVGEMSIFYKKRSSFVEDGKAGLRPSFGFSELKVFQSCLLQSF